MLYEDIRLGCRMYHQNDDSSYDKSYEDYLCNDKAKDKWRQRDTLDLAEAGKILAFLNLWKTPMQTRLIELHSALQDAVEELAPLMDKSILDLDLSKPFVDGKLNKDADMSRIISAFNRLANCGVRNESVASSKILHTINPDGFVMWDREIRAKYAQQLLKIKIPSNERPLEYALYFLPVMQEIANKAVNEVMEQESLSRSDAIQSFTDRCECKNTLAKIIDEYNFAKFKKGWI